MNILGHTMPNDYSIVETATNEVQGYSRLYTWECKAIDFHFQAWVSYSGDYSLAVSEMRIRLNETLKRKDNQ